MAQLPAPLRATLGLAATVADLVGTTVRDGRGLPPGWSDKALELPVLAVSTALQLSLRAQQQYVALTARGDELLSQLRGTSDEPPAWATFDDDLGTAEPAPPLAPASAARKAPTKRAPAKKSPAKRTAAPSTTAKKPSAFDLVDGDER